MKAIITHEAKTHPSLYLAAIEQGEQFVIARGKKPVAMLGPIPKEARRRRPKVGESLGLQMSMPDSALAPMTDEELKLWYGE